MKKDFVLALRIISIGIVTTISMMVVAATYDEPPNVEYYDCQC